MNIRKEIEDLVFNKYGHTINNPLSIKTQAIKFMEEYKEWQKAKTKKEIECEIGDMLFVAKTLETLTNFNHEEHSSYPVFDTDEFYKYINKCDVRFLIAMIGITMDAYRNYFNKFNDELGLNDLLQNTILKNQGRTGKIINGCYVKSEDI